MKTKVGISAAQPCRPWLEMLPWSLPPVHSVIRESRVATAHTGLVNWAFRRQDFASWVPAFYDAPKEHDKQV